MENVASFDQLRMLTKIKRNIYQPGEIVHINDTDTYVVFNGTTWEYVSKSDINTNAGLSMTMYDLNKSIVSQLPLLTLDQLQEGRDVINSLQGEHFMLLCKDISYFTIFQYNCLNFNYEFNDLGDAAITCIQESIGDIVSIDKKESGEIEIWIKTKEEDCTYCAYLFNCEQMIVNYGG